MSPNWFDAGDVLHEMSQKIDILLEETQAINKRLHKLATITAVPVWGYAGMLLRLANGNGINDVFDVYRIIELWRNDSESAEESFREWNKERLK